MTTLVSQLPGWALAGTGEEQMARLRSPAERERIIEALDVTGSDGHQGLTVNWSTVYLAGLPGAPQLAWMMEGNLAEAAEKLGIRPAELALDILVATDRAAPCVFFIGIEEHVRTLMQREEHTVGSDGILVGDRPHPRSWGTFPRMLETYVREEKVLTLVECVRHMTSAAADRLRLPDRGRIAVGARADLVVFDKDTIKANATYAVPRQAATGIFHVMVNGRFAVEDGKVTGARAGRVLRMNRPL
jgi:N-acyl-D-amino-acid deacylase